MAYEIRTLATLATQARLFFTQSVPGAVVKLWANTFTVFGKVFALLDFEHELRRQYLYAQLFASTAATPWLTRHGFELGMTQDPGNFAVGTITVPATAGLLVPAGLQFVRSDGRTYTTLASETAGASSVDLPVQSDLVGSAGNSDPDETLTLIPVSIVPAGLDTEAVVSLTGLGGGTDPETIEQFRARILYRKRNPPQGGSAPDYIKWTFESLASVAAVYVDSFQNDSRSVWVCFTVDDQPSGIPSDVEVATVQAYVDDPIRRPVTARVFATAPTPIPVGVSILGLAPYTSDTTGSIEAELVALFRDTVQPAKPSASFTLYREQIDAAIARATGVNTFTLLSPSTDLTYSTGGQMPVLGDITYS